MDKVTQREIMRGVRLTCVRAERFKTGCLSMSFLTPHTKKTAAQNAVLPYVLRRGTARLPDMESIAAALDDLYGARIEPAIRKKGEVTALGFCADFPDGAFLPGKPDVLSGVANLMGELILSSATRGGRLRPDYVEDERRNLIDDIKAEINDKRDWAGQRLLELMFRGESYGVSKLGTLADARMVGFISLTRRYKELTAHAPLEVVYCGAEPESRVEAAVREALAGLPRLELTPPPVTRVDLTPPASKAKYVTEKMDVTQGRLIMGYRLCQAMERPDYAALAVFNAALGGSATSRLFTNVRERLALCYYVDSIVDRYKGAMFIAAGIETDKYELTVNEITSELASIADSGITETELEAAKRAVISSVLSALDDPIGVENLYLDRAVLELNNGTAPRPSELAAMAAAVTAEDIRRTAAAARLGCVYFLASEDGDAKA